MITFDRDRAFLPSKSFVSDSLRSNGCEIFVKAYFCEFENAMNTNGESYVYTVVCDVHNRDAYTRSPNLMNRIV